MYLSLFHGFHPGYTTSVVGYHFMLPWSVYHSFKKWREEGIWCAAIEALNRKKWYWQKKNFDHQPLVWIAKALRR